MADQRAYPEQQNPPFITLVEASRPVMAPQYAPYPNNGMAYEFGCASHVDTPMRMFNGPIGPSPEEDPNAPFYVPRRPSPTYQDFRNQSEIPRYIPPSRNNEEDLWRSGAQANEYRIEVDRDERHPPRPPRAHDRKPSNFPYPKQPTQRDRSIERYQPPNVSRPRRHNGSLATSRPRRGTSIVNHRQGSREPSIPSTSQHTRQYAHDEPPPVRPLSRPEHTPHSPTPRERGYTSPKPLAVPTPVISSAPKMWVAPQYKKDEANTYQAISILDHMLEKQSLQQILDLWEHTRSGPNPRDYLQWKGWNSRKRQRTQSPETMQSGFPGNASVKAWLDDTNETQVREVNNRNMYRN